MAYRVTVKGTATINGRCCQNFSETLYLDNTGLGDHKYQELRRLHPDWQSINVNSWDCDGKWV